MKAVTEAVHAGHCSLAHRNLYLGSAVHTDNGENKSEGKGQERMRRKGAEG